MCPSHDSVGEATSGTFTLTLYSMYSSHMANNTHMSVVCTHDIMMKRMMSLHTCAPKEVEEYSVLPLIGSAGGEQLISV